MSSKKRLAAVAITIAALTAGSTGIASAHDGVNKGLVKATVLADLVKAGTITQAQADAISKKFDEVRAAKQAERAAKKAANPGKTGKHGKAPKAPGAEFLSALPFRKWKNPPREQSLGGFFSSRGKMRTCAFILVAITLVLN
jgi:hypothetical protein